MWLCGVPIFSVCFLTRHCVHRWMWTYLTVVGFCFLFFSLILFVRLYTTPTVPFCGCGIEHLVRWQLGVTELKGEWVVCCGVLAGPTWNGGFRCPARLNVRGRWEEDWLFFLITKKVVFIFVRRAKKINNCISLSAINAKSDTITVVSLTLKACQKPNHWKEVSQLSWSDIAFTLQNNQNCSNSTYLIS